MEVSFPKIEADVLELWKKLHAFEKSVEKRKRGRIFVFYDGPPTANAGPGLHHMVNRVYKDVILRYKTMQGFFVPRRAGWDTHGLPVELQIEKKLGLQSKKDIEQYGVARFNQECRKSVWEYKQEWEKFNERVGLWIDMEHSYSTYDTSYIETLWYIIKKFWDTRLLYKDYKVVPYCPRCGTPLSSHELAQGYKTVKENSVFVKFLVSHFALPNTFNSKTYLLAWTTTPWTLPGNVALAVHPDTVYVLAQKNNEQYIVAKALAQGVLGEHTVLQTLAGKDLLRAKYSPVFQCKKPDPGKKIWEVVPAHFVSVTEGTGIVHTAVAYGEDDFLLGKKENLAMLHLVDEEGKFTNDVVPFQGMFVKDADSLIIEDLKKRNLLFKEQLYEHEYPFCWRCSTPLLYYAKESWFINIQKVKHALLANNKSINWIPSHIKEGRMGEWLKDVKDWAFSRERYWGTPLPVWECKECKHVEVIGSLRELQAKKSPRNTFYIVRHGESLRQKTQKLSSWPEKTRVPLTQKGKKDIERLGRKLKKKYIDCIISSDLLRTRQTAEILGKMLNLEPMVDVRLRELDAGLLNGKHIRELGKVWGKKGETEKEHYPRRFDEPLPNGESWVDVRKRMLDFVKDVDKRYEGKSILLVGHEAPFTLLETALQGLSREETILFRQKQSIQTAEMRMLPPLFLPLNEEGEVDLHRPYVDEMRFVCPVCKKGNMERIRDVADVWFDSGAMPFAEVHWPFAGAHVQKSKVKSQTRGALELFPADYIVEAIDQTRGWFYTLLAVSTLLGFPSPYKNVISLGHLLDEKGNKMSKSKGNIVNPWDIAAQYGADPSRWYFFTASSPGDPKLFAEKDIQEVTRRFFLTLWNCFVFYKTYVQKSNFLMRMRKLDFCTPVLDAWILSRLQRVTQELANKLDLYDITGAARTLERFVIEDVSLWYIRRSRGRFQNPENKQELQEVSSVLAHLLLQTTKLASPFIPFFAEYLYQELTNIQKKKSVHWEDFPLPEKQFHNQKLENDMAWVRDIVAKALALRAKAGMKVRQPLQRLKIKNVPLKISKDLLHLLADEVNVKEVIADRGLKTEVELDTALTQALKAEGVERELLRMIQAMRKEAGYKHSDRILVSCFGSRELCEILTTATAREVQPKQFHKAKFKKEFEVAGQKITIGIAKI